MIKKLAEKIMSINWVSFMNQEKVVIEEKTTSYSFYKQATENGYIGGKYKLGYYYDHGIIVDIDKEKAFDLYKEAAEGGNIDAQKSLALLYKRDDKQCYLLVQKCLEMDYQKLNILLKQQEIQYI